MAFAPLISQLWAASIGIYRDRGWRYFVKRVPKPFAHVDPRSRVSMALVTESERVARARAPLIRAELMAYWEALAAGETEDAKRRYAAV
ncbi:MAG: DUF6538 domain-containing protein [Pseudomonadota bacterium]